MKYQPTLSSSETKEIVLEWYTTFFLCIYCNNNKKYFITFKKNIQNTIQIFEMYYLNSISNEYYNRNTTQASLLDP